MPKNEFFFPPFRHILPQQDGVLVLRKPKGPSSAACIARIKHGFGQKKIGHAGTLDPMAEGVLLVLLGQATKISGYLLEAGEKMYSGIIRLGTETDTWDITGAIRAQKDAGHVDDAALRAAFAGLLGAYEQEVPPYSAAKHEGRPLYALARKGLDVPVKKKLITISRGEAELVGPGRVRFRVTCGSGAYIRTLAHSLGIRLGCGAALEELVREYSHPFGLDRARSLEELERHPEDFAAHLAGLAEALPELPVFQVGEEEAALARNGGSVPFAPGHPVPGTPPGAEAPEASGSTPAAGTAPRPSSAGLAMMLDAQAKPLALARLVPDAGGGRWTIARGLWNP